MYELNVNKIASKRPRHCLPYAVITWLKFNDGTEWPHNFNELDGDVNLLATDSLQVALQTEDSYVQTKVRALVKTNLISSTPPLSNGCNHEATNGNSNSNDLNGENHVNGIVNNNNNNLTAESETETTNTNKESVQITNSNNNENNEVETKTSETNEENPTENHINENNIEKTNAEKDEQNQSSEHANEQTTNENSTENGVVNNEITNQPVQSESPSNQAAIALAANSTSVETSNVANRTTTPQLDTNGPIVEPPKSDTPNSGLALVSTTTPVTNSASPTASTASTNGTGALASYQHKTNLTTYAKPTYPSYRQNPTMVPYLYATQAAHPSHYHPYGGIQYGRQIPGAAAALQAAALSQFQAAQAPQMQQQVFLCRGPNGLTYVTAAPNPTLAPQQLVAVQQAQAQANAIAAIQQQAAAIAAAQAQQVAAIQGQTASTYAAGPTAYSKTNLINQIQQQPQQQIIYQAAPQPASNAANKVYFLN